MDNRTHRRERLRLSVLTREAVVVLRLAFAGAKENRVTTTAQALAYSLFLAIPSAFLVVLGVFSLVASPADVTDLIERGQGVIPSEAATLLRDSLQRSTESPRSGLIMTAVGAALALWATTSATTTLMQGVTTAFARNDQRGFVRKRLTALLIVICLATATILVGGLLVLGPFLESWVGDAIGYPSVTAWVWWTAQWPILAVGLLLAFGVLLYLGPDVEQPSWKLVTPGAIVALLIWLVASAGFSIYAASFGSYNKAWGTLAAVVVMLIWLWLTSAALLFGAEVNAGAQRLAAERQERRSS
jgi:membrane protein